METKAKLIMNAIKLDRSEIRLARERIYTTVSYIAAASFAITAFLVGPQLTERDPLKTASLLVLIAIIDVSLLAVLWGLFLRYMADLRGGQIILEKREYMLYELQVNQKADEEALDIFRALVDRKDRPRIAHNELYWVAIAVSGAMLFKLSALFWILRN